MQKPHVVMSIPFLGGDGNVESWEHEILFCPGSGNGIDWWEVCQDCTEKDKWEMRCAELDGIPEMVAHGVEHKRFDGEWMINTRTCGPCSHPEYLNLEEVYWAGAGVFEVRFGWDEEWYAEVSSAMPDEVFQAFQKKNNYIADLEKENVETSERLIQMNIEYEEVGRIR